MLKPKLRRPSPALVVATVACVIATGGVAISAPSGPDGVIHACYDAAAYARDGRSGIEIVASPDVCSRPGSDFPDHFTFNATGPAGAPGAVGPQGAAGVPGPMGASGVKPISKGDVKALEQQQKDVKAIEKKVDKGAEQLEKADTKKEQQEAIDRMIKQIVTFLKELQDQQAQQGQIIRKLK